jgi:hypothetical protein
MDPPEAVKPAGKMADKPGKLKVIKDKHRKR